MLNPHDALSIRDQSEGLMEHIVEFESVAHGGWGVTRQDGQVCFVPFALPGDRARIAVERCHKGILWGRIVEIVDASPDRVKPWDPATPVSGAHMWLDFAYPAQARWKQQIVRDSFARIGKLEVEPRWHDVPELRLGYRTRAEFHVQDGRVGYYVLGTHDVTDISECPLCHERLNKALAALRECEPSQSVEITINPENDDILIWTRRPDHSVASVFPQAQHMRTREPRRAFLFDGVPVVNGCFSQSSLLLNRMLTALVHQSAPREGHVLDLYCGTGNFTLALPDSLQVTGLDHNRAAIAAASTRERGDYRTAGEDAMARELASRHWDLVVLDPPRAGAKQITGALARCKAHRIVYVSCDPATLARDCRSLATAGWGIHELHTVDMFPHTPHVESVCVLERA